MTAAADTAADTAVGAPADTEAGIEAGTETGAEPATETHPRPALPGPPSPRDLGVVGGYRTWAAEGERARVRFVGRGPKAPTTTVVRAVTGDPTLAAARVFQVHTAEVHRVEGPGLHEEGDALYTRVPGLAVAVVTADCVPVLVEAGPWVAAIHAGWRGLVAGIIPHALECLRAEEGAPDPTAWRAWIGPVNSACCYEVGDDVARQVADATTPQAVVHLPHGNPCGGSGDGRPHLDLLVAAKYQLDQEGVPSTPLVRCTQCDREGLFSYRRSGQRAGRNFACIWLPTDRSD